MNNEIPTILLNCIVRVSVCSYVFPDPEYVGLSEEVDGKLRTSGVC